MAVKSTFYITFLLIFGIKKEPKYGLFKPYFDLSCRGDLNSRPPPYQGDALPAELQQH